MNGTRNWPVKLRCALACDTTPGAKPQNSAPRTAPARLQAMCRDSTQYQANAVNARFPVSTTRNATDAPRVRVIGATTAPTTTIEVFTARLTPIGALSSVVHSGLSRWDTDCAAYPSSHSNSAWSPRLCATTRWFGSTQSCQVR